MSRTDSESTSGPRRVKRYGPKKVNPSNGQLTLPRDLLREWGLEETPGLRFDVFGDASNRSIILVQVADDEAIDELMLEAELDANRKRVEGAGPAAGNS